MKVYVFSYLLCVCALTLNAQPFNKTYYLPNYDLTPKSVALLDQSGNRDFVVGSIAMDITNPTNPPKYLLSKMNASGVPIKSVLRDDAGISERIVETFDDNIVTVTEYRDKIIVRKYDNNLTSFLSVKIDKETPLPSSYPHLVGTIDVEAIHFPGAPHPSQEESYFIYFTEGYPTAIDGTVPHHTCVSVISLDRDLNLKWCRTYPEIGPWESWQILNDVAYSMTKFPNPNNPSEYQLALAGTRNFLDPGPQYTTFYMTIDLAGDIVAPYTEVTNSIQDMSPDILFDGDSLAVAYQPTNSMDISTPLSVMFSIIKFDVGLSSFRSRFYWNIDNDISVENYSSSIAHGNSDSMWYEGEEPVYGAGTDNNYVLGGQTFPTWHQPQPFMNPILMSVDRISLDPMIFKRFNVDRWAIAGVNGMFHRNDPSYRQYLPVEPDQSTGMRMIVSTPALNACGGESYEVEFKDTIPGVNQHEHTFHPYQKHTPEFLNESIVTISHDNCINSGSPATYKQSTGIEEASIMDDAIRVEILPTLISNKSNESIQCKVSSQVTGKITIRAINLLGQQLYNQDYSMQVGENVLSIDASNLTTGMNIMMVLHENTVISTTKLQVLN